MAEPLTMTLADLAELFRRSVATTSRHVARLQKQEAFPAPLPGRKPKLWSRHQVQAWLRDPQHAARSVSPAAANDAALDPAFAPENVAAARARLAARYGAPHA
ncbi:hypothetical protein AncyloWKF20_05640 [Ancylobacter sp. WKF20]|uniref:helix-turn-helix transcriptional regulator n=1 Tax=Ancylobacter sp. WKF20 TaxID=3039801 RepID=UPI0024343A3F|nr:hypothetical protein [Ancylobacter sp. WKF20]WGD31308.1 hypothetical protein AncyloWKF20_05640 [Ancylobacter sp. WKF20]